MKNSKLVLAALTAGAMAMSPIPTLAGTNNIPATFNVKAAVTAKCSIKTPPVDVDFGEYDPLSLSDNIAGSGQSTIKCTKGTIVEVTVSNPDMVGPTSTLAYSWYSNPARTAAFGTLSFTSASNADNLINFYGKIPFGQDVGTGNYTVSATFNVNY